MTNLSRTLLVGHVMGATAPTGQTRKSVSRKPRNSRLLITGLTALTLLTFVAIKLTLG